MSCCSLCGRVSSATGFWSGRWWIVTGRLPTADESARGPCPGGSDGSSGEQSIEGAEGDQRRMAGKPAARIFPPGVDLTQVDGIGMGTLQTLATEVGPDLPRFRSA